MIKRMRLKNFKNFHDAELVLGPFSLLIGTNASGKSNIREAFRFLQGIARGYTLAEILGERYAEGGVLQWRGIRGGLREVAYAGESTFRIEVIFSSAEKRKTDSCYIVEVQPSGPGGVPVLVEETLQEGGKDIFRVFREPNESNNIWAEFGAPKSTKDPADMLPLIDDRKAFLSSATSLFGFDRSIFGIEVRNRNLDKVRDAAIRAAKTFNSMRFFEFDPEAMRVPSNPGQTILGDRGENLSTALMAICENPDRKRDLLEWIKALTPMDAADFEFPLYADGKTLVTLVESGGRKISANSASDGTLRFLAILVALFGPSHERFNFIEELENGLHPTRLHLLVDLIEQQTKLSDLQIVATTHSPQLLRLTHPDFLEDASVIYRLEDRQDAQIRQIASLPDNIQSVLRSQDTARLFESGWFENTLSFLEDDEQSGENK